MTTATTSANVDAAVRTQLEYYGGGSYDLAERFVPPTTSITRRRPVRPAARTEQTPCCAGCAARSATSPTRSRTRGDRVAVEPLTERAH